MYGEKQEKKGEKQSCLDSKAPSAADDLNNGTTGEREREDDPLSSFSEAARYSHGKHAKKHSRSGIRPFSSNASFLRTRIIYAKCFLE